MSNIEMIQDHEKASAILPSWFITRMMVDEWYYSLVTVNGYQIGIASIEAISSDGKWIEVNLLTQSDVQTREGMTNGKNFITAVANDRTAASIQVDKIVMAYEISSG